MRNTTEQDGIAGPIEPAANDSRFRVADLLLCILATSLAIGLLKRHAEESAMASRLNAHPPLSVWTRLVLGHAMSSFGLVFGLSRLTMALRARTRAVTFGTWLWSIVGVYVCFHVIASVAWAMTNVLVRPILHNSRPVSVSLGETMSRVSLMTFGQACFDELAWLLAAAWVASALFQVGVRSDDANEPIRRAIEPQDITASIFSGLVIFATVFQRLMESAGY